mmetsp:Transcript_30822/g.99102  ORF Transcript_30822/g.99102 Transcript_30822/m.99102 type:complete len:125 (+) Transcript_30822:770-1144(+)
MPLVPAQLQHLLDRPDGSVEQGSPDLLCLHPAQRPPVLAPLEEVVDRNCGLGGRGERDLRLLHLVPKHVHSRGVLDSRQSGLLLELSEQVLQQLPVEVLAPKMLVPAGCDHLEHSSFQTQKADV